MKGTRVLSWLLIIGILFSATSAPVFAQVTDVPSDHWAYQAVVSLVNRGFLATYEDGSFQGTNPVDRYTFAITIARMLDEIETGRVVGTQSDADILRTLTTEFSNELVQFYADQEQINQLLENTRKQLTATEERVSNVVAQQAELTESLARMQADLMMESADTFHSLSGIQSLIQEHNLKLADQQDRIRELQDVVIFIEDQVNTQGTEIYRINNWIGEKDAVFAMIDNELTIMVDAHQEQIDKLSANYEQVAARNRELEMDLQNVAVLRQKDTQELKAQIEKLQTDLNYISTQVGVSEEELAQLNRKISDEIAVQMNAALIRERGLSGSLQDLEAEFERYQVQAESEIKSARNTAIIAIAAAAVGIILNFVK